MKKLFNFNKKTIVATCYGVVLFTLFCCAIKKLVTLYPYGQDNWH